MILGVFGLATFTLIHTVISLVAIVSGLVVLYGLLTNQSMKTLTEIFLSFTVVTTATGFLFPLQGFTPALATGFIATIILVPTLAALYLYKLKGPWRSIYVVGAVISLYLNCFVLVVQSFQKIPPLHALAPTGSEPPFAITQGLVLLFFIVAGYLAAKRFRPSVFS